jgi:FkbM family methyltransferase
LRNFKKNIDLIHLKSVTAYHAAVAEKNGQMQFLYNNGEPTQGKLIGVEPSYAVTGDLISVATVRLDTMVNLPPPDFIKIDVEGAAAGVLSGAANVIRKFAPMFYFELHGPEEQVAVREYLLNSGYVAEDTFGNRVSDPGDGWHSPLLCYKPERIRR